MCKDFFRKCTGFGKKSFNNIFNYVRFYYKSMREDNPYDKYFESDGLAWKMFGTSTKHLPPVRDGLLSMHNSKPSRTETHKEEVLAFLDNFFEGESNDIDKPADAGKSKIRYTNLEWTTIHNKYKESCTKLGRTSIDYDKFTGIRYVTVEYFNIMN